MKFIGITNLVQINSTITEDYNQPVMIRHCFLQSFTSCIIFNWDSIGKLSAGIRPHWPKGCVAFKSRHCMLEDRKTFRWLHFQLPTVARTIPGNLP